MIRHGLFVLALACTAPRAEAQFLQPELRLDVSGPSPVAIEPGIGLTTALGTYARLGVTAGYDVRGAPERAGRRWRGDVIARVTLDPFRQQRWALSLGGGISYRGATTYLAALADVEGPEVRGMLPAIQIGVSGGVRGALILRRARRERR
ncbi:MAG TPA: hypothetical protein VEB19_03850 [Gemmatimonadaceae bacterium]|nr:hypothetical protein [Gemmatimonadaceae bacterium]